MGEVNSGKTPLSSSNLWEGSKEKLRRWRNPSKPDIGRKCIWTRWAVSDPVSSRTWQLWTCSSGLRVADTRKGLWTLPPQLRKLQRPGMCQHCQAWSPRKAIVWRWEGEAWIVLETPTCFRCQSYRIPTKESCRLGVGKDQEREVSCSQQSRKDLDVWRVLTSDMVMKKVDLSCWV